MALITAFEESEMPRMKLHDLVDAKYFKHERDGRKLLQINTYGRKSRKIPGKENQTIQLDEESAAQLFDILKSHFGFK